MQKSRSKQRPFWIAIFAISFTLFVLWFFLLRHYKYTTDAYVAGNQILITPLQDGFITDIYTDNTFLVAKNQLLVQLDPTDAQIAFDAAAENLSNVVREVCLTTHQTLAYAADIEVQKAKLILAIEDWQHRIGVIHEGGVSLENLQRSEAILNESYFGLVQAVNLYQKELALLQGQSIKNNPLVLKAGDQLAEAWVRLYRTRVYSPVEGIVAQRTGQVGMWVSSGQSMMSVIPLDQIWIHANYKETQMARMRIGQKVYITADMYGLGVVFHGNIVGLPMGAGNAFSLLPPQNLSGNWIKIVQRLPVRVALDLEELKAHPLRIGMTCRALTDLKDPTGLLVPDNTQGPHYTTDIYVDEVTGAPEYITKIIMENIDPPLFPFAEFPIETMELPDPEAIMRDSNLGSIREMEQTIRNLFSKKPFKLRAEWQKRHKKTAE